VLKQLRLSEVSPLPCGTNGGTSCPRTCGAVDAIGMANQDSFANLQGPSRFQSDVLQTTLESSPICTRDCSNITVPSERSRRKNANSPVCKA
jgi:hypothetical protein